MHVHFKCVAITRSFEPCRANEEERSAQADGAGSASEPALLSLFICQVRDELPVPTLLPQSLPSLLRTINNDSNPQTPSL